MKQTLERLKKRKEDYHIKYCDPVGRRVTEKVPKDYRGLIGARKYEAKRIEQVSAGDHTSKQNFQAKISEICEYYLDFKLKGKKSWYAGKTVCNHIKRHIGSARLNVLDRNPEILIKHFREFPEDWSEKYIWNYMVTLRAAISFWIKKKKLRILNPVEDIKVENNTRTIDYVPTKADFDSIIVTSYSIGLPDYVRHIFIAVWETGLRISEVLSWRIEDLDLREPEFDREGMPIRVPMYTTLILKQKKSKKITVPMSKPLHEAMVRQVGDRQAGRVWKLSLSRLYRKLREVNLLKEAGVKMERPFHDFRKSMKTRLKIEKRLPNNISKQFMGHQTDAMDEYYTKLSVIDLWCAVEDSWRPGK